MNFSLNFPSVNILPVNIEKLIGELSVEFNKIKNQTDANHATTTLQQIFVEFQEISKQFAPQDASQRSFLRKREALHDTIRQAEQSAHRLHGNSSYPQQVFMAKAREVKPKVDQLSHEYEEAKKNLEFELQILNSMCEEILNVTNASALEESEKNKVIEYLGKRKEMYTAMVNRKYSIS